MRILLTTAAFFLILGSVRGAEPAVDRYGDPLPPGAIGRLGTIHWRVPLDAQLTFSADGKVLFAASGGRLQKFDPVTGRELSCVKFVDDPSSRITEHNPRFDRLVRVGTREDTVILRNATCGTKLLEIKTEHWMIASAMLSPDGDLLATRAYCTTSVCLWNTSTGKQVRQLLDDIEDNPDKPRFNPLPHNVAFSSEGKLASASEIGEIGIWDYRTGKRLPGPKKGDRKSVDGVAFSPDGRLLAWNESEHGICVWDVAAGREHCRIPCVRWPIGAFRFSPDGMVLMSAETDGHCAIHFWDTGTGREKLAPDTAHFWNSDSGRETLGDSEYSFLKQSSFALSPDGRALAVVDQGKIRIISPDLEDRSVPVGHEDAVLQVAWSADGTIVASGSQSSDGGKPTYRTWDVRSSKPLQEFHKDLTYNRFVLFDLAPDGRTIAVVEPLRLFDTHTGRELPCLNSGLRLCKGIVFSADGKALIALVDNNDPCCYLRQWHTATGVAHASLGVPRGELTLLGRGPNGHPLFVECGEEEFRLRCLQPSRWLGVIPCEELCFRTSARLEITLSQDGRLFAAAQCTKHIADGKVEERKFITIRESRGCGEIACLPIPDIQDVEIALSPDGTILAVAVEGGPIGLYVIGTNKPFRELVGQQGSVTALAFSPDGSKLLSGAEDTTILIWDVADRPRQPAAELSPADLQRLWADLAGNVAVAYKAMSRLTAAPKQTLPFLKQHLQATARADARQLTAWIADLDREDFDTRQRAEHNLTEMGEYAEIALQELLKRNISLEVSLRAERILDSLHNAPPDEMRRHRAIAVLERIDSPASRDILDTLAKGAPLSQQTLEAKTALQRLVWRSAREAREPKP